MLISPANKPGFYVDIHQVIAVSPAFGMGFVAQGYDVLLRDGRTIQVSIEHGEELLSVLPR